MYVGLFKYSNSFGQFKKLIALLVFSFLFLNHIDAQNNNTTSKLNQTKPNQNLQHSKTETLQYIDSLHALTKDIARRNPDSVFKIAKKIKALSLKINYEAGIAKSDAALARGLMLNSDYEKGFKIAKQNLIFSKKIKADTVYLECINIIGLGHFLKGEYHSVFESNYEGLTYAKEVGNLDKIFFFSLNAGTILSNVQEYDKALPYFESCLKMLAVQTDSVKLAKVLNNLGNLYFKNKNYKKAKEILSVSIEISSVKKMNSWESYAHIALGEIAIEEKNFNEALARFNISQKLLANTKDFKQIILTQLGLARLDLENNTIESAENRALKILQQSKKYKYYEGITEATELLQKTAAAQNNYLEAYDYVLQNTKLKDSLDIVQNTNKIQIMIVEKSLKNEQKLVQMRLTQELAKQKMYIAYGFGLLICFAGIIFIINKSSKTQKMLIAQLHEKSIEQTRSENQLVALNKTKNKLFSIIGHDLKGPISAFQGLLKLLVSGEIERDEFMSFVPKLFSNINHLDFTLNNLLLWARTQMSGEKITPSQIDLKELIAINFKLIESQAKKKKIILKNHVRKGTFIWCDSDQIDIVLRNLVSNALKFTAKNGTITVTSNEKDRSQVISIHDTGVGLAKEAIEAIFKTSTHRSTYGTNEEKGTGLGLSICKEMVKNNNGSIWVESELHIGTTFHFSLPKSKHSSNETD